MMDEELDPREQSRDRRRDREMAAERRALMRAGMGKVFKQIRDAQARTARELDDEPPATRPSKARRPPRRGAS
jgi:hypothetical protein